MRDLIDDVAAFHRGCDVPAYNFLHDPKPDRIALRVRLIEEEVNKELIPAFKRNDIVEIADGVADAIYVIIGTALEYGERPDEAWNYFATSHPFSRPQYNPLPGLAWPDRITMVVNGQLLPLVRNPPVNRRTGNLASAMAIAVGMLASAAIHKGIPIYLVWKTVQRSNMAKIDSTTGKARKDPGGKVLKPDGWTKPDIKGVLQRAGVVL